MHMMKKMLMLFAAMFILGQAVSAEESAEPKKHGFRASMRAKAHHMKERVKEHGKKAMTRGREMAQHAREKASHAMTRGKEMAQHAREKASHMKQRLKEKANESADSFEGDE